MMPPLLLFQALWAALKPDTPRKKQVWAFFVVLLLCAVSFGAGYGSHKPEVKVETRVEYKEKVVEKVVTVKVKEIRRQEKKDVQVIKHKDGSEVITSHFESGTDSKEHDTAKDDQTKAVDSKSDQKVATSYQPNWRLGPQLGFNVHNLGFKDGGLTLGNPILGVEVERRIAGPFWGGVWGHSSGEVGLTLKLEF